MSPRIGAALSQTVAPVASSSDQQAVQRRADREQDPQHPKKEFKREQPNLRIVDTTLDVPPDKGKATSTGPPAPNVTSATFVQLTTLQQRDGSARRMLGTTTYQVGTRRQKKSGKLRKGTMLDHKAE